jgi:hypothetical protein
MYLQICIQMTIVNFNLRNIVVIAACLAVTTIFLGCDSSENEPKAIEITNEQALTQDVFADETEGRSGVQITTTSAWTSRIEDAETLSTTKSDASQLRAAAAPDWISISPDHGDKAGSYTIQITLAPNTSEANRSAVITIICNDTKITISVTQKNVKEDGKTLTTKDLLLAHPWRLIKQIQAYPDTPENNREETMSEVVSLSADGKITNSNGQNTGLTYTLSGNNITITGLGEAREPMTFKITQLTDYDLEFIGEFTGTGSHVAPGGSVTNYTYTWTWRWIFIKP